MARLMAGLMVPLMAWPAALGLAAMAVLVASPASASASASAAAAAAAAAALPAPTAPTPAGPCATLGACRLTATSDRLWLRDGQGAVLAQWPLRDAAGQPGQLLATAELAHRRSFVVALRGLSELWEISTDPQAAPIYDGLVHDWRLGEGVARPGYLGLRRIRLDHAWVALWTDARLPWVVGAEAEAEADGAGRQGPTAVLLHLANRRALLRLALDPGRTPPLSGTCLLWRSANAPGGAPSPWRLRLPAAGGAWQWVDVQRWRPLDPATEQPVGTDADPRDRKRDLERAQACG